MFSSKAVEVVDLTGDDGFRLELEGIPSSQARPRLGKYGFYNPNSREKTAFKAKIRGGISNTPIFPSTQPVVVNIKFFMRRPNTHFRNRSRSNELRMGLPFACITSPDIDNLAKFVLDGMNQLV